MTRGKWGNWSAPFAPWVIESWRKQSEANGWPAIADEVRKNLLAKMVENSGSKKGKRDEDSD